MSEAIKEIVDGSLKVSVWYDTSPQDPREYDNLSTMMFHHKKYSIGDQHKMSTDEVLAYIARPDVISAPVWIYDHSGIALRLGNLTVGGATLPKGNLPTGFDQWDTGLLGFMTLDFEKAEKEYGKNWRKKIDMIRMVFAGELLGTEAYTNGHVYGFTISTAKKCEACGMMEWKVDDSCGGFYDMKDMLDSCSVEHKPILQRCIDSI